MADDPLLIDRVADATLVRALLTFVGAQVSHRELFDKLEELYEKNEELVLNKTRADELLSKFESVGIISGQRVDGRPENTFAEVYLSEQGAERLRALLKAAKMRYESEST